MNYFSCPRCHGEFPSPLWDEATRAICGGEITEIEDAYRYSRSCWYICPGCGGESDIEDLKRTKGPPCPQCGSRAIRYESNLYSNSIVCERCDFYQLVTLSSG